jgi:xanthine/CO dehydrogenase XdhC/CoxF family maturation factor
VIDRALVEAAARLRRQGEPYVVATVVRAARRSSIGSRLILGRYRWLAGTVSGGRFDGELSASAWMHTKDAGPVVMTYDTAHPDIANDDDLRAAFGLGDGGSVEVMLERAGCAGRIDMLELATRCTRQQRRAATATVIASAASGVRVGTRLALLAGGDVEQESSPLCAELRDSITVELRAVLETGATVTKVFNGVEVLLEAIIPPPRLFLIGESHDLVPLAQLAKHTGWDVVVCAETPRNAIRERFVMADEILVGDIADIAGRIDQSDRAACVIASHDADHDRACLAALRPTRARYLGVSGSHANRIAPEDARVHEIDADSAADRAFAALTEARAALATPAPSDRSASVERPAPSRPSAVFAAIAAL